HLATAAGDPHLEMLLPALVARHPGAVRQTAARPFVGVHPQAPVELDDIAGDGHAARVDCVRRRLLLLATGAVGAGARLAGNSHVGARTVGRVEDADGEGTLLALDDAVGARILDVPDDG